VHGSTFNYCSDLSNSAGRHHSWQARDILHRVLAARIWNDLLDFCFPGICALCEQSAEPGQLLCDACDDELKALERRPACWKCAAPLATPDAPCPFCRDKGVAHYDQILRIGVYEEPLDQLIQQLKYNGRWSIGEALTKRLFARAPVKQLLEDCDVIMPVPLHFVRQFRRGYNQAAVVAKTLSTLSHKRIVHPLSRIRNTDSQTRLRGRQKRFENLKDAFRLRRPRTIAGKHVVVVDDVTTTGATLQIVARTLAPAKPSRISAVVLAASDPKGRDFTIA
jgi:ComF family protein